MARRSDFAGMTKAEWVVLRKEELARLATIRDHAPRHEVPMHELAKTADVLDRCVDQVRRMLNADFGRPRRPAAFTFDKWLLPLLYAHGQLLALHEDLIDTRRDLLAAGLAVPPELSDIPESYQTFWCAYSKLPRRVQEFHRKGANGFRQRMVYLLWSATERNEIWQGDSCCLDIWIRPKGHSTALRPWLIVFVDDKTRMVMGAMLCLQQPTAEEAAACLVRAMRRKSTPLDGVWFGGVPGQVLCDNGPEFKGEILTMLTSRLSAEGMPVVMRAVLRYTPTLKGKVERWFGYFQKRVLWSLSGYSKGPRSYTNRDVFRGSLNELMDEDQLWAHINERIEHHNFRRVHRSLGRRTPLAMWAEDTTPLVELDMSKVRFALLLAKKSHTAHRYGVEYRSQIYLSFDDAYDDVVGEKVLVGAIPHDRTFIELFRADGSWICTAYPKETFDHRQAANQSDRRRELYKEVMGATDEAHALGVARQEAIGVDGAMPSLVATSLSRRSHPVTRPARVTGSALAPAGPVDDEWLAASRRAAAAPSDDVELEAS